MEDMKGTNPKELQPFCHDDFLYKRVLIAKLDSYTKGFDLMHSDEDAKEASS